jgi:hypothetical protein
MMTFVPGGAMGVLLSCASAGSRGLIRQDRKRLSVVVAWSMRWHQRWSGKSGSVVASVATKWSFHVAIACSAALWRCYGGGTSLNETSFWRMNDCIFPGAPLSRF